MAALVAATFLAACYEPPPPKEPKPGVTAESLKGKLKFGSFLSNQSNFRDPALRVIRDPDEYDEAWQAGFTNTGIRSQPWVNFDAQMVILVATGTRPRSGYTIRVDSIVAGDDLAVYVAETEPGPGCSVINRIYSPAAIVTLPFMEKPVRFVEERRVSGTC